MQIVPSISRIAYLICSMRPSFCARSLHDIGALDPGLLHPVFEKLALLQQECRIRSPLVLTDPRSGNGIIYRISYKK